MQQQKNQMKLWLILIRIYLEYQRRLRFFTVYGPWGRPDMAIEIYKAILNKEPIKIFNNGNMKRDFTYVSDLVEGISLLVNKIPKYTNNKTLKNDSISRCSF